MRRKEISNKDALSNPGISRCMDALVDLLHLKRDPPRWIADMKTMELSERQPDNSYRAAYRMIPIGK